MRVTPSPSISSTGVLFETAIPVAVASPQANQESFLRFALVGLYVGIVPVALGLLWYPSCAVWVGAA